MKVTWSINLAAAAFAALSISCARADDSRGFYLGLGASRLEIKDQAANPSGSGTLDLDSSTEGYKAFFGYRMTALPLLDLAAEAGYHYFNKWGTTGQGHNFGYALQGGSVAGLVILPLGPVDLFGKGGAMYSRLDKNIDGAVSSRSNGSNAFYGAGIGLRIGRTMGLRAEYEYVDAANLSRMQIYSASFLIRF